MKYKKKSLRHHIIYSYCGIKHEQKPIEVIIFPSEHYICTLLQRRGSKVSKGFLDCLKFFIWERETAGNYAVLKNAD